MAINTARAPDALDTSGEMRIRRRAAGDLAALLEFPRLVLGRWPTPVETCDTSVGKVLLKRDDLSGVGRGGAKARKIESLIGHLRARGHRELVTVTGNITNLAFDLVPPLRDAGIRPTALILDDPPVDRRERERWFAPILGDVRLLGESRAKAAVAALGAFQRGREAGRRPLLLLPGASHPAAVAGNANGFVEMVRQLEEAGEQLPHTVFVTAASGTTIAGFLLAEHALRGTGRPPINLVGVQVYPSPVRAQVVAMVRWTERVLRLKGRVPHDRITLLSSQLHGGFGCFPDSLRLVCDRVRRETGIAIDPIFGGKTWAAMEASRPFQSRSEGCMYWHCGYTPEWRTLRSGADPSVVPA